ncbi:serine protease AprX [Geodermatophilus pulveris]|uniref:Serine protease AprX n=1 Tax=Geodermatophilus pulveris TaxID=1564159 RepID=A0A239JDA9_9ACTN|nr:S8 family serine peptidase [Geodermatophilus pulveris]SNT03428.1 serine protease AprX [Geodermatophilus pulveris]
MDHIRTSVGTPGQQPRTRRRFGVRGTAAAIATSALAAAVLTAGTGTAQAAPDAGLGYDPVADKGSLHNIAEVIGAHASYRAGYTGKGIGIALIDTGVTNVPGLHSGNVVDGADLSFDSQDPELAHLDAYGHGTHLASIIAGREAAGTTQNYQDPKRFTGIAPDATLVDVKVGASDGAVDVTQVIAAINWVVEHRNDHNIRVINLSYGTDSTQPSSVDPLAFAVENAWRNGVVVVVAGGNDGQSQLTLANPASDPYVLAVGAVDTKGTTSAVDDTVPEWSTRGSNTRHVDVVAPGVSVLGTRVPNGYADERNPTARVGDRFAKASGTSQAAAVASGAVALLLQQNPTLTPDQVKRQLMSTAMAFSSTDSKYRGNGTINVRTAQTKPVNKSGQSGQFWGSGTGSIEAARGTSHVHDGAAPLQGEVDIFGNAWDPQAYAAAVAAGTIWDGGTWRGVQLTGAAWESGAWPTVDWGQGTWTARTWRTDEWTARTWREGAWVARTWREGDWSARTWRDEAWSARTWRTADFAGTGWV